MASEKHLRELQARAEEQMEGLPPAVASLFSRLSERYDFPVVPMVLRTCSGCLMTLPEVLVQDVRRGESLQRCPNCGRVLYLDDSARLLTAPPRGREQGVRGVSLYSSTSLMLPRMRARTKEASIRELAHLMASTGCIEDPGGVIEAALRRESLATTAVGSGLAFPHARGVGSASLTLALGTKPKGIQFGAPDGFKTKLIFMMVVPPAAGAVYLHLLSSIARSLKTAPQRNLMLAAKTPGELWSTLEELTRPTLG